MHQRFTVEIDAPPDRVFPLVADLANYQQLLDVVHRVVPDGDGGRTQPAAPAWLVTLRAAVGPLARSKRLRMVRTVHSEPSTVRFERRELDDRDHAPWALDATVEATGDGSRVVMSLAYGGRLWSGVLDRVLEAQVPAATRNLQELAAAS